MKRPRFKHYSGPGWTEWVMPIPKGYLMKCCDCGLVHEMQFKAFIETRQRKNGTYVAVDLPWPVRAQFRVRRKSK